MVYLDGVAWRGVACGYCLVFEVAHHTPHGKKNTWTGGCDGRLAIQMDRMAKVWTIVQWE